MSILIGEKVKVNRDLHFDRGVVIPKGTQGEVLTVENITHVCKVEFVKFGQKIINTSDLATV